MNENIIRKPATLTNSNMKKKSISEKKLNDKNKLI